jgi:hypothetical protein
MNNGGLFALSPFNGGATSSVNGLPELASFNPVSPGYVPQPGFTVGSSLGMASRFGMGCMACQSMGDSPDLGNLAIGTALQDANKLLSSWNVDNTDNSATGILDQFAKTAVSQGLGVVTNDLTAQNIGNVVALPNGTQGVVVKGSDGRLYIQKPDGTSELYQTGTTVTAIPTTTTSTVQKYLPFIIGGVVLLGVLLYMKKK